MSTSSVHPPAEYQAVVDAARAEFVDAAIVAHRAHALFDSLLERVEPELAPHRTALTAARARLAAAESVLKDTAERVASKTHSDDSLAPELYAIKHKRTVMVDATDDTIMAWLRAKMPALILPESFDRKQVADTVAGLPPAIRPDWLVLVDTVQAQIARTKVDAMLRALDDTSGVTPAPPGLPSFADSAALPWD